jgi:ribonuclease Y
MNQIMIPSVIAGIVGLFIGIILTLLMNKIGLNRDKEKAKFILSDAETKAKNTLKQGVLDGKTQAYELKLQAEKEAKERQVVLDNAEKKLERREDSIKYKEDTIKNKEKQLDEKLKKVDIKNAVLEKMEEDLQQRIDAQLTVLEKSANMSVEDAKTEIMNILEKQMEIEKSAFIREQEDEAIATAKEKATEIITTAIMRYSQEETIDRCVSVINLPSEEMKGRIIGREGRNIRAIEKITGVDLIIDDTPETITVSCFDPIRREIARMSLELLIKDGRIQPQRIEEVVEKCRKDVEETVRKAGEDACFKLRIGKMDRELVRLVGRLRYRYSYGQNGLEHSKEVAALAGMMAAELGLNQTLAKRAGLLHDIGKSLDFEMDGTHVELGARFAKKYGENDTVINSIASHHGDIEATSAISILVAAADTLSAARPGARYEEIKNYINRLEALEAIGNSFEGVERTFAVQAGREVRVVVVPEKVNDERIHLIAHQIAERIENELTYPGQIKVNVIREVKASEIAK